MKTIICSNYEEIGRIGAYIISNQIRNKPDTVLGLATGSTPIGMYANLVDLHKRCGLDFSQVVSYNLDEYYPILKSNDQSYDYFMWDNLFSHINIKKENVHLPNGETDDPATECANYDAAIENAGGIDIQVLGIGNNGHIGFNEPASEFILATHVTGLTDSTIEANSRFFADKNDVPIKALTMGNGSIMKAKKILLLISGKSKAAIVKKMLSGSITPQVPASILMVHPDVTLLIDEDAASELSL